MAVENYICENCQSLMVCAVKKKLCAFGEEANTQLGVDIEIKSCKTFQAVKVDEED